MSKVFVFFGGIVTGMYIAQTYHVPNVKTILDECRQRLSDYEKSHRPPTDHGQSSSGRWW